MKVIRIAKDHTKNRYRVDLENEHGECYSCTVDEDVLVKYHLHKGKRIEESFIKQLEEEDLSQQYYHQALKYLGYRMRSVYEMRQYLRKKNADAWIIEKVVERLKQERYLDDVEFAERFVQDRIHRSTKGPQLIKQELINLKGIEAAVASEALSQYTEDQQYERAMKIAHKRLQRKQKDSIKKQLHQIQAALMRNGFPSSIASQVVEQSRLLLQETFDENEALEAHAKRLMQKIQGDEDEEAYKENLRLRLYRQGFSIEHINRYIDTLFH